MSVRIFIFILALLSCQAPAKRNAGKLLKGDWQLKEVTVTGDTNNIRTGMAATLYEMIRLDSIFLRLTDQHYLLMRNDSTIFRRTAGYKLAGKNRRMIVKVDAHLTDTFRIESVDKNHLILQTYDSVRIRFSRRSDLRR